MSEKLVTIVVLPLARAHILKMRLEEKGIKCELEDVHLIEGAATSTVRVKILENDLNEAFKEVDLLLGLKSGKQKKVSKPGQILVPIDFSTVSEKAVEMAFNIAEHLNAKLVIMHSYISPVRFSIPYGDIYPYDTTLLKQTEDAEEEANQQFKNFLAPLVTSIGADRWENVNPEYIVKPGYAEEDILAFANEQPTRLIVIGRGGDKSWPGTVGSVTADVMYNASVPVLVIPENMELKPVEDFKEVLYATNFDEKDFTALDKLMSIVKSYEVRVVCAHVGLPDEYGWDIARLEGMKDILHKKYESKEFECKLIMGNNVLDTLESTIKNDPVDILALTTHKRGMISRLFNPSLARKMVFHSEIPLLVFHA
ncbi:universal stress protein [uncultured Draconibacterium sp.]|uniref:universal stress protein n=1 Tax=uncultured Draconibacterium sp. TaxID=1573823 RepID=UPI0029C7E85A|nr:universal stress protein [uncultured Draconibacterium sp.]